MKTFLLSFFFAVFAVNTESSKIKELKTEERTVTWNLDKVHSSIRFSVPYMGVSEVEGWFEDFDGKITSTGYDFTTFLIEVSIKTKSIYTGNSMRDTHLKTGDFFKAGKYPEIIFRSKSITSTGDNKYKLTGDLTIKAVTKEMTFEMVNTGLKTLKSEKQMAGFLLTATINRYDWGVAFNMSKSGMDDIIGNNVHITANIVAKSD